MFLKQGAGNLIGTVYVETFGLEVLEMVNIEVVEDIIEVEILYDIPEIEVIEIIDVEIIC